LAKNEERPYVAGVPRLYAAARLGTEGRNSLLQLVHAVEAVLLRCLGHSTVVARLFRGNLAVACVWIWCCQGAAERQEYADEKRAGERCS